MVIKNKFSLTWLLTYLVPILMLIGGAVMANKKLVTEPAIENRIDPIRYVIIENNKLIRKIVSVEDQKEVLDEMRIIKSLGE